MKVFDISMMDASRYGGVANKVGRAIDNRRLDLYQDLLAPLHAVEPDSFEYAVEASRLLLGMKSTGQGSAFFAFMRVLDDIRPPATGGRMKKKPPERFGEMWPHQRLGHATWTDFVTAPIHGVVNPECDADLDDVKRHDYYSVKPGLGWSRHYEKHLWRGWLQLKRLFERAYPEGNTEGLAKAAGNLGPFGINQLGKSKGEIVSPLSTPPREVADMLSERTFRQSELKDAGGNVQSLFDSAQSDSARPEAQELSASEQPPSPERAPAKQVRPTKTLELPFQLAWDLGQYIKDQGIKSENELLCDLLREGLAGRQSASN